MALLLPVLRLGLMLPAHPQGLGMGRRLLLTRQDCPAVILSAYKDCSRSQWKTAYDVFTAHTIFPYFTIFSLFMQLLRAYVLKNQQVFMLVYWYHSF